MESSRLVTVVKTMTREPGNLRCATEQRLWVVQLVLISRSGLFTGNVFIPIMNLKNAL